METHGKGDDSVARDSATPERRLSKRQQYSIELLREGLKDPEVACLVGVRQSLLRAWKGEPPVPPSLGPGSSLAGHAVVGLDGGHGHRPGTETPAGAGETVDNR